MDKPILGIGIFKSRPLVVATKHRKEEVIAVPVNEALGVHCFGSNLIDTDLFGTFSGETKRVDDPLTAARKKCELAMNVHGCDLAIASEGSFGPHPNFWFVAANEELLVFIDRKHRIEVAHREISFDTNFNAKAVESKDDLESFAKSCGFPTHAIILRESKEGTAQIRKGITTWSGLYSEYAFIKNNCGSVYAETDMRAMHNPTRMNVIKKGVQGLINKIKSCCPQCELPGFALKEMKKGLPCRMCGSPTRSILSHHYVCCGCNHQSEKLFPDNKQSEDPTYCDVCNP
ncbi:MAG: DUF6671 family protein [Bacteroidota bacterium]